MKILVIAQYFWPEGFRINELTSNLVKRGHEVTVLTGIPNYPEGHYFKGYGISGPLTENYEGARVVRAPLVSRGNSRGARLALNYLSFAMSACLVGFLRCRDKYDVIFVYEPSPITVGLPAVFLRALRKIPVVFWVQDLWPESLVATGAVRSPRILSWVGRMVKFIYDRCDRILVQSRAFRPEIEKFGVDPARIEYFPNSAEAFFQSHSLQAATLPALPAGFRVMFAGNIGAAQDFGTILAAAEKLKGDPQIQWVILGDGRMRGWVEGEIKKRGLSQCFHLLGRFPVEAMPQFFAQADAMLVTLKDEPIFAMTIPAKVQSYLACGRPIVAAVGGEGARVVTEAGAGVSCSAESPEGLADAVLALYRASTSERAEMGRRGQRYFEENFESQKLVVRLEGWMHELAGKSV
jgi:glycosyltransferase involved in cell wall biosynthesis